MTDRLVIDRQIVKEPTGYMQTGAATSAYMFGQVIFQWTGYEPSEAEIYFLIGLGGAAARLIEGLLLGRKNAAKVPPTT
jgi:hypothetical protein